MKVEQRAAGQRTTGQRTGVTGQRTAGQHIAKQHAGTAGQRPTGRYADAAEQHATEWRASEQRTTATGALSDRQSEIQAHYGTVAERSATACDAARGCGKPLEWARLQPGERVLDLGCGAGAEVVCAASQVGHAGHVFGLDMTPQMLELARRDAREAGAGNVSFLQGFIEEIPLPDCSVDVVVSNCVINLSDDKARVLREAHRVLRPGGRLVIADIVLCAKDLPTDQREVAAPLLGCVNGVLATDEYADLMRQAGFSAVGVDVYRRYPAEALRRRAETRGQQDLWARVDPTKADGAFGGASIKGTRPSPKTSD